jgi:hypothetical protein
VPPAQMEREMAVSKVEARLRDREVEVSIV